MSIGVPLKGIGFRGREFRGLGLGLREFAVLLRALFLHVRRFLLPGFHFYLTALGSFFLVAYGLRVLKAFHLPRGSKYPNSRVLGPKIHTLNGFWTLKPYYLGTWTLWVRVV